MPDDVWLAPKSQIKKCTTFDTSQHEPDFLIFKRRDGEQMCHIVELKDGHAFDTKKASKEREALHQFSERNGQHIQFIMKIHVVAFNHNDRDSIVEGFKNKITREEAMTGREFCELLEIDYDQIVKQRQKDAPVNFRYFIKELMAVPDVKNEIRKYIR